MTMKSARKFLAVAILASLTLSLMLLTGCLAAAAAGAAGAGVAYAKGDTAGLVKAEPAEVMDAARAAFGEVGVFVTGTSVEPRKSQLRGRTAADQSVRVTVTTQEGGLNELSVRVGTFGDEALSAELYRRIVNRLGGPE